MGYGTSGQYLQILHPDFDFKLDLLVVFDCALEVSFGGGSGFLIALTSGVIATLGGRLGWRETRGKMKAKSLEAMAITPRV